MSLTTADFILVCVAAAGLILGGFAGFSGALSFVIASGAAFLAGRLFWPWSVAFLAQDWARALATLVAVLLIFGIVRWVVRKLVGLALAQPADFIFGALVGGVAAGALSVACAWGLARFGIIPIDSVILAEVKGLVG